MAYSYTTALDRMDKRYGILSDSTVCHDSSGLNFGMEMTIREYENALLQIEKHEATIKDLRLENNHLQSTKQRAESQVRHFCFLFRFHYLSIYL